jgi:DNA-binding NarL/FixJ family response regulator
VLKRSAAEVLMQALHAVAGGGTFIDPEMAGCVTGEFLGTQTESPAAGLSEREVQVARLIALGYSNKQIAARLKLSVKTIETYKTRSMEKLVLQLAGLDVLLDESLPPRGEQLRVGREVWEEMQAVLPAVEKEIEEADGE